jgi:tetratricopeptide (TPR) repeat protein
MLPCGWRTFLSLSGTNEKACGKVTRGVVIAVLLASSCVFSQAQSQKPALIRDTDAAEGKEEVAVKKEQVYDPAMAEKTVKIGNYYFKKKNYAAAIERYLEAMQYQPSRAEAYEALGRAYEKNGDIAKALDVYRNFIQQYPDSPKIPAFRSKLAKLEKPFPSRN